MARGETVEGVLGSATGVVVLSTGTNLYFVDASSSAVLKTVSLSAQLGAAPAVWNSVACCAESGAGSSTLHAYDLSQTSIPDRWSGVSVSGSVQCTPVFLSGHAWFANSLGQLLGVAVGAASPPTVTTFDALGLVSGARATVRHLAPQADGQAVVLFSDRGVYAVQIAGAVRSLWSALGGLDVGSIAPARVGSRLVCASGCDVHVLEPGVFGVVVRAAVPMEDTVEVLLELGPTTVLVGCSNGAFVVLDLESDTSLGRFQLTLPSGGVAWTRSIGNLLISYGTDGTVVCNTFTVGSGGTIQAAPWWTPTATTGFSGPPTVAGTLAIGVSTAGKLYIYDIGGKAVATNGVSITSGATSSVVAYDPTADFTSTANVGFLLDGENFFPTLRNVLIAVLNGSFATPPSLPSTLTFEALIEAIGQANHPAYVMMWNTSLVYALMDAGKNWTTFQLLTTLGQARFAQLFTPNGALRGDHRINSQTAIALGGAANVQVYLETYESNNTWFALPVELGSNHQKIVIASVGGTKLALVSGFNTITPSYYDEVAHTLADGSGAYDGHSWHDTGLILSGPAVDLVEAEFDRRWSKQGSAPSPSGDTYVKFANWMIARSSVLGPSGTPPPYQDPRPTGAAVPVQVAITSNERFGADTQGLANPEALLTNVHEILDRLVAEIARAESYIYLENFTFSSAELTQALAQRIANAPAGFQVIVMLPHPTVGEYGGDFTIEGGQLELVRNAYAALKLSSKDWSSFALRAGDIVTASDPVQVDFDHREITRTRVTFTKGGSTRTVPIGEVMVINDNGNPPTVVFCSPARYFTTPPSDSDNALQGLKNNFRGVYIHSKLVVIDGTVAVVGSANFNRRSMRTDGEMSVIVDDPTTAASICSSVFSHWNMTTASAWVPTMNAFSSATSDALGVVPLDYAALPDKPVTFAWSFLTSVIDPSQLL